MFCNKCGAQIADGSMFCDKCGAPQQAAQAPQQPQYQAPQQPQYQAPQQPQYQAPQQPQYQAPQQPQYQAPQQPQYQAPQQPQYQAPQQPQYQAPQQPRYQAPQQPMNIASLKKYTPFIAVGMAAIALIFGIIVLFNMFDVSATVSAGSWGSQTASGDVSEILEGDGMGIIQVGNIIFGLVLIVIAAVGGLFFAKNYGVKIYDALTAVPFVKKDSPLFAMGALGAIGALIHFICFLCAGSSESSFGVTASVSVSAPWFTWVILIVFAGIAALDMFVFNKKN